jgi:hypothetical protein
MGSGRELGGCGGRRGDPGIIRGVVRRSIGEREGAEEQESSSAKGGGGKEPVATKGVGEIIIMAPEPEAQWGGRCSWRLATRSASVGMET